MLFKNTLAQSASFGLGYLYSIVLAPIMIDRLGLDAFGVWAVTGALATYAGLLDLGFGKSVERFIAIYDVNGEEGRIRESVALGCLIVAGVAVVASTAAIALAPLLSDQLGVLDHSEMRLVLLASVAIWTCNGFNGIFSAVCEGKRQMIPSNVALSFAITLNFAFSVAALASSDSLTVYAYANAAAALLGIPGTYLAMRHVWAGPHFAWPSWPLAKEIISFSAKNQLSWFADLINLQTDKLIIALMIDVRSAAIYEIGARVVSAVRGGAVMATSAIIPTAAARLAEEGSEAIGPMYRRYLTRVCSTAFPLYAVAAVSSPFLLVAWLGSVPSETEIVIPILSVAYLVNITTGASHDARDQLRRPRLRRRERRADRGSQRDADGCPDSALRPLGGRARHRVAIVGSALFDFRFLGDSPFRVPISGTGAPGRDVVRAPGGSVGSPRDLRRHSCGPAQCLRPAGHIGRAFGLPYWALASRRGLLPGQLEVPLSRFRPRSVPGSG